MPPAAGGVAPTSSSSGGWGLGPQTPKTASQCEFLATPLLSVLVCYARILPTSIRTTFSNIVLTFATTYLCKSGFSALVHIKKKARNQRKVNDDIRLALSSTKPRIPKLALWLHTLQRLDTVALTDIKSISYLKLNIFEVFFVVISIRVKSRTGRGSLAIWNS